MVPNYGLPVSSASASFFSFSSSSSWCRSCVKAAGSRSSFRQGQQLLVTGAVRAAGAEPGTETAFWASPLPEGSATHRAQFSGPCLSIHEGCGLPDGCGCQLASPEVGSWR